MLANQRPILLGFRDLLPVPLVPLDPFGGAMPLRRPVANPPEVVALPVAALAGVTSAMLGNREAFEVVERVVEWVFVSVVDVMPGGDFSMGRSPHFAVKVEGSPLVS